MQVTLDNPRPNNRYRKQWSHLVTDDDTKQM